jgi:hypothetical protein
MTVDDLVAEAKQNTTGPVDFDGLSPSIMAASLGFVLQQLLENIDYEADRRSDAAIAARMLAAIINRADESTAKGRQS